MGQVKVFLIGQEKSENHISDFVKNRCFQISDNVLLTFIDIVSVAFVKGDGNLSENPPQTLVLLEF